MDRSWMPKVAGILDIVAGSISLVVIIAVVIGVAVFSWTGGSGMPMMRGGGPMWLAIIFAVGIPLFILDILAIVGGIFALKRKCWGLALAGSIAAVFPSWLLGVAAIVFISLSRSVFKAKAQA